jgi:hypothetical protein
MPRAMENCLKGDSFGWCLAGGLIPPFPGSNPGAPASHRGLFSGDLLLFAKRPHFRRLAVSSPVSGQESGLLLTGSLDPGGVSLLAKFSISEICTRERAETGCVSAETSSNLAYWGLCAASTGCGGFLPQRRQSAERETTAGSPRWRTLQRDAGTSVEIRGGGVKF